MLAFPTGMHQPRIKVMTLSFETRTVVCESASSRNHTHYRGVCREFSPFKHEADLTTRTKVGRTVALVDLSIFSSLVQP